MILLFYNLALLAALAVGAPWWLWKMATTHKYREGLLERLGRVGPVRTRLGVDRRSSDEPVPSPPGPLIWVHAVSVGEVLAVTRLVKELETALPDHRIVVSTTTRTGQALARERFGANRVFYCPLDLPWAVRVYLNTLRPQMLILAETEFWPNLLSGCFRRGIPVAVVNTRISDRSWPRYRRLRALWKPFLSRLSLVLAQSETDAERLRALGCTARAVSVSGNLKFDVRAAEEVEATRLLRRLAARPRFLVAGSTLEGEEAVLIEAARAISLTNSFLITVLAPRHPERFAAVSALLDASGIPWVRRSEWRGKSVESLNPLQGGEIVLLDTIGELASVYSLATVAFVGGSLIPAGGHNPLEPAQFGVPIVMGPHYANFRTITEDLLAQDAVCIAEKGKLGEVLVDLLCDRNHAQGMGARARMIFAQQAGATARTIDALLPLTGAPQQEKWENRCGLPPSRHEK
jgi:3-deoxy-D-manno-octulosonic-acid transferase